MLCLFFFSSRRRHTRSKRDWSSDVCSSDLVGIMESTYVNYVTINTYKEHYNNIKVRKAMNHEIYKEAYIKVVKNGYAQESDSPLPATNNFYEQQETYEYDLDKAKELLAEAGYPDGFEAEIWGSDSSKDKRGMEFIQQQLAEVGDRKSVV